MVMGKPLDPIRINQETGYILNQELQKKDYCPPYFSFIATDLLTQRHLMLYMHIFLIKKVYPIRNNTQGTHICQLGLVKNYSKRNPNLRLKL